MPSRKRSGKRCCYGGIRAREDQPCSFVAVDAANYILRSCLFCLTPRRRNSLMHAKRQYGNKQRLKQKLPKADSVKKLSQVIITVTDTGASISQDLVPTFFSRE